MTISTVPTQSEFASEALWHEYRKTDSIKIRNQIAELNDRLARKIAHRMAGQSAEPIEDLTQTARAGLIRAIERFDHRKGVAFSSFAVPFIRGEILHDQRDHGFGHLKIPRRAFEEVGMVKRSCAKLETLGRQADPEAVAKAHGINSEKWAWLQEATQRKPLANIDEQHHLFCDDEEEGIHREHEYDKLKAAIARLPRLKRACLEEHWFKGMSEGTIARKHRIPLAQVQEVLEEGLEQLKKQLVGV